jgi:hypothetical protein
VSSILAVAILVLPGALFVRREEWERAEPIEIAGVAFACSAAFWAVSFWALRWLPISLATFATATVGASLLALGLLRRQRVGAVVQAWRLKAPAAAWQAGFLAAALLLRLFFLWMRVAYSGGDMTAHAAMAETIVLADGFPTTQEPLLPIPRFGEVSPGFHVLSALMSLFASIPTYRSTIVVLCVSIAAFTFALYALLRALSIPAAAAAAGSAGALFLARNPQFFLQWGGAPSILATVVLLALLRDALDLSERRGFGFLLRTALLAAGALLIHPLPVISFLWTAPLFVVWRGFSGRGSWRTLLKNVLSVLALSAILASPFLRQAPRSISPAALAWAHVWFRAETRSAVLLADRLAPRLGRTASASSWPFYIVTYLGALPAVVLAIGLARGLWSRRQAAVASLLVLGSNAVLFAAALGEFLPGWPALYPTRIGLWLAIPLAVAFAEIALSFPLFSRRTRAALGVLFAVLFGVEGWRLSQHRFGTGFYETAKKRAGSILAVPANEAVGGAFWVTTFCQDNSAVTRDDLAAFDWISTHTPSAAIFGNNPGDGGGLIPAAAHRKIFDPHYYWFFDSEDMKAWRAKTSIDYVYVGSESAPPWPRRWAAEQLDHDPRVELVWSLRRARVYRVKESLAGGFR